MFEVGILVKDKIPEALVVSHEIIVFLKRHSVVFIRGEGDVVAVKGPQDKSLEPCVEFEVIVEI